MNETIKPDAGVKPDAETGTVDVQWQGLKAAVETYQTDRMVTEGRYIRLPETHSTPPEAATVPDGHQTTVDPRGGTWLAAIPGIRVPLAMSMRVDQYELSERAAQRLGRQRQGYMVALTTVQNGERKCRIEDPAGLFAAPWVAIAPVRSGKQDQPEVRPVRK